MSLKTIFKEICEKLNDVESITKKFSDLKNDEERFSMTYDICVSHISDLKFDLDKKSSEKSEEVRKVGNDHFSKKCHWEALRCYNESIALAPSDSVELAFAYGNRASCLLRLDFPTEALQDVERALRLPAPENFKNKLLLRKEKCLTLLNNFCETNDCAFGSGSLPVLSRGKSSFFDSASDLVELSYDKLWERQLIANDNIRTGEVLVVEKPFSSVLLPDHYYTHCSNCFTRSFNLVPCSNCSKAMFCSEECLTDSENRYHKTECSILNSLAGLKAERMELLSLRILIDAAKQGKHLEKLHTEIKEYDISKYNNNNESCLSYKSLDFINIYKLVTSTNKRTASDLFYRSVISAILIFLLEKFTGFFVFEKVCLLKQFCGGLILRFMQSLPCNAHEISEFCDDGLNEIGAGAYATLSLINHSCDPNVVRYSCKDVIVLRTIKPIKKGEQILDNYGYHYATHSYNTRQNSLLKQYYFKCMCEACTQLWPLYENLPDKQFVLKKEIDLEVYKKLTEEFEKNLNKVFYGNFNLDVIDTFMVYLDFLDEYIVCPWKPYNQCQEALKHCLSFLGNHLRFSKGVVTDITSS